MWRFSATVTQWLTGFSLFLHFSGPVSPSYGWVRVSELVSVPPSRNSFCVGVDVESPAANPGSSLGGSPGYCGRTLLPGDADWFSTTGASVCHATGTFCLTADTGGVPRLQVLILQAPLWVCPLRGPEYLFCSSPPWWIGSHSPHTPHDHSSGRWKCGHLSLLPLVWLSCHHSRCLTPSPRVVHLSTMGFCLGRLPRSSRRLSFWCQRCLWGCCRCW